MPTAIKIMPDVKIQLEKAGFYPGQRVTGLVTLNVTRPVRVRGVRISLIGTELIQASCQRKSRWISTRVVEQEILLAGRDRLPDTGAVIVDTWDSLLQRGKYTQYNEGEYIYPFAVLLPSHAPPSYKGRIARVDYTLELSVDMPMRRIQKQSVPVWVMTPWRDNVSNSSEVDDGEDNEQKRLIVLPSRRTFIAGEEIQGEYTAHTVPGGPGELVFGLHAREQTYAGGCSGQEQWDVAVVRMPIKEMNGSVQKGTFCLKIPENVVPAAAGKTFALTYHLHAELTASGKSQAEVQVEIGINAPPDSWK